jgi:hypothetical protein
MGHSELYSFAETGLNPQPHPGDLDRHLNRSPVSGSARYDDRLRGAYFQHHRRVHPELLSGNPDYSGVGALRYVAPAA